MEEGIKPHCDPLAKDFQNKICDILTHTHTQLLQGYDAEILLLNIFSYVTTI